MQHSAEVERLDKCVYSSETQRDVKDVIRMKEQTMTVRTRPAPTREHFRFVC